MGKLIYLIACVIDIELTGHIMSCPAEHLRQAVTQYTAPGITHMHRTGGVGGNKFHHDLFRLFSSNTAIILAHVCNQLYGIRIPLLAQAEVQEARSCNGDLLKIGAVQCHMCRQTLCDFPRCHVQRTCALHGEGRGIVAVFGILRDFYRNCRYIALRQVTGSNCGAICVQDSFRCLLLCLFD